MYSEFNTFEELERQIIDDHEATGMDYTTRNRYPIRFVLLDNFRDCSRFVDFVQKSTGAVVESVDKWIDPDYPDLMITHSELAERIAAYIRDMKTANCVIAPFSELARFYDNEEHKEFDALLKTIKAIEATAQGAERAQRVYIPIVGLEGKMETFKRDTQSLIWRLHTDDRKLNYRLILTDRETFGVRGLDQHYTVVRSVSEWLNVWKDADKQVTPNIICTSRAIFANQRYAQPDNAFTFTPCRDAYEFLTKGLQLSFGGLTHALADDEYWATLAQRIDLTHGFSFDAYVKNYFGCTDLNHYETFIRLWLEHPSGFERWLVARYYQLQLKGEDYICRVLTKTTSLTGNDFIEKMALYLSESDTDTAVRQYCLRRAAHAGVVLQESVASALVGRLKNIASERTAPTALRYCTGISPQEYELIVDWLGRGLIRVEQIREVYPDLYHYCASPLGLSGNVPDWLAPYIAAYKHAKVSNEYTQEVAELIARLNASEVSFDAWYQRFSTTRTLLQGRSDIDLYYWVDGLGVDWIPLIKEIVREKNDQGVYLNDIKIARALLPSKTDINRVDLQKLQPGGEPLTKVGDLDALAHQSQNAWPNTLIKELNLIRNIIEEIIQKYNGKKVAIISDHGLSYLPQLCQGLGLTGVESDHHGRIATRATGTWTTDEHYMRLEDGRTACALRHKALCNKVPKGQGSHGGATPEEVLVPIFILSSDKNGATWSVELLTHELQGTNPVVQFRIKNLPTVEVPVLEYNGQQYELHAVGGDVYESSRLVVDENCENLSLTISDARYSYSVDVSAGAHEEDIFGGF